MSPGRLVIVASSTVSAFSRLLAFKTPLISRPICPPGLLINIGLAFNRTFDLRMEWAFRDGLLIILFVFQPEILGNLTHRLDLGLRNDQVY
ncbi:hypothetical protein CEXT_786591 [Caerostris extrusa]|uniref:Uncharacterized protein n=1 Tax=Caerostris extrusa TaxID=172846 RepID=A0AAV4S1G5_CAEEX|nr:hypothetical protein CEXT_786591 [Caerostris extrusa]